MAQADRERGTRRHAAGVPVARHGRKDKSVASMPNGQGCPRQGKSVDPLLRCAGCAGDETAADRRAGGRYRLRRRYGSGRVRYSRIALTIGAAWDLSLPYSMPGADTRLRARCTAKAAGGIGDWGWHLHPVALDAGNLFFWFDEGTIARLFGHLQAKGRTNHKHDLVLPRQWGNWAKAQSCNGNAIALRLCHRPFEMNPP